MICISSKRSYQRRWTFVIATAAILTVIHFLPRSSTDTYIENVQTKGRAGDGPSALSQTANCPIRQMDDILVILKTGATEAQTKVPVHLRTTLRCVPHYAIVSDYEEVIDGVRTHDILRNVSEATKVTDPDFGIYNRLRTQGRPGLLRSDWNDDVNGPFGNPKNPGWKLDKWKFLPMLDKALEVRRTAKWYVFVEADTYVVWPNLVAWLAQLDPERPYYLGAPMQSGDTVFGYGGAGIILSSAAVRRVSAYREERPREAEALTASNWAGDKVLGHVLQEVGAPLVWSWPMLQTDRAWEFDPFGGGDGARPWCYPAVSYHHMSPGDIEVMWKFEQKWFEDEKNAVLLHGDVFTAFLFNGAAADQRDWDNLASGNIEGHETTHHASFDGCAQQCDHDPQCLQFSYRNGTCVTSQSVIRGVHRQGVHSGWKPLRIQALVREIDSCPETQYIYA